MLVFSLHAIFLFINAYIFEPITIHTKKQHAEGDETYGDHILRPIITRINYCWCD